MSNGFGRTFCNFFFLLKVCQQPNKSPLVTAECYTAFSDVQNALIMDVCASNMTDTPKVTITPNGQGTTLDIPDDKSLIGKDGEETLLEATTPIEEPVATSNFEQARASIASALEFNRHDRVTRPSTKRQAPKPPVTIEDVVDEAPTKDLPPEPIPTPPPAPPMPKSALVTSTGLFYNHLMVNISFVQ